MKRLIVIRKQKCALASKSYTYYMLKDDNPPLNDPLNYGVILSYEFEMKADE